MSIPGSQYLGMLLHVLSQSLLVPVILGLLFFLGKVLMELGGLLNEFKVRKKVKDIDYKQLRRLADAPFHTAHETLETLQAIPEHVKSSLVEIRDADYSSRRVLAGKLLDEEEEKALATLERTELIARLGPMFGLMGTLIPLGPGLAALGAGDLNALAQAMVIAFDTTVAGLAVGGLAFWISKTRRRWYTKELCLVEDVLELFLGVNENAAPSSKTAFVSGGRH
ncbi:MAG: MotA/TolQ/ExbB proton channel family protein [Clostridiales bacterium]|jgi:biopolymer transport protein ExbB/TolQ|nr:MotA/TolQ/ExbB proton channel family protein [Clostridiales bacterium]